VTEVGIGKRVRANDKAADFFRNQRL
jgi:hypothetical protein